MVLSTPQFVYDPSTLEFQEHIWDVYRTLRDEYPVYVDEARHQYVLSRFDDVWRAVNDWESFSSVVEEAGNFLPQMIYMDPVRHTQLRALVSRAFTPKRVAEIEPLTRSIARDLVDGIAARGRCDLQHDYAAVLPSMVIGKMIGVPDEHIDDFRSWTDSFLEIQGPQDYLDSLGKCYELFAELLAERRRAPRDDLMSALLAAEVEGQRLREEELLGFCFLLVLAGNDTTASLIGTGAVLLATDPEQRAVLVRDPSSWANAVEEINRLESPAQVLPRTTTCDVELHGTVIPSGSRVMLVWGSANHDEREFTGSGAVRHRPRDHEAPRLRPRRPLLPRRQPGSAGGTRRVRGVARPASRLRARRHPTSDHVNLGPGVWRGTAPLHRVILSRQLLEPVPEGSLELPVANRMDRDQASQLPAVGGGRGIDHGEVLGEHVPLGRDAAQDGDVTGTGEERRERLGGSSAVVGFEARRCTGAVDSHRELMLGRDERAHITGTQSLDEPVE